MNVSGLTLVPIKVKSIKRTATKFEANMIHFNTVLPNMN